MRFGERTLECAMNRALTRDRTARRNGRSVLVDSGLCSARDIWMAVETDVIVRGKVDVGAVADHRLGAGNSLVNTKERIGDAKELRRFADHPDFAIPFEFGDI